MVNLQRWVRSNDGARIDALQLKVIELGAHNEGARDCKAPCELPDPIYILPTYSIFTVPTFATPVATSW